MGRVTVAVEEGAEPEGGPAKHSSRLGENGEEAGRWRIP